MASTERTKLCDSSSSPARARFISVEVIGILLFAIQAGITSARLQYVRQRLADAYNYTLPQVTEGNCTSHNISDVTGRRIQSETAIWVMWMSSLSTIIPIVTSPLLVASSDLVGRKPLLVLSAVSHALSAVILVAVAHFHLQLEVMLISKTLLGVFGDVTMPTAVCLAYTADSTTVNNRALKMAILEVANDVGWGFGKIITGVILQETNDFTFAFSSSALLAILYVSYVACPGMLLETVPVTTSRQDLRGSFQTAAQRFRVHLAAAKHILRWQVIGLLLIKVLLLFVVAGVFPIATIVGLSEPFCWRPITVGIYESIVFLFPAIVSTLLIRCLSRFFNEYWIIHLGLLTFSGQLLTTALATNSFQFMYVATLIGCIRCIPSTMVKLILSKLVSKDQQGTAFAMYSLAESISLALSPFFINGIYSATVRLGYPRLIFYISIAILCSTNILNGILQMFPLPQQSPEEIELHSCGPSKDDEPEADD